MVSRNSLVRIAFILCLLIFLAGIGWLSLARYWGYNVGMLDLGNINQAIWSATQGKPLVYTEADGPISNLSWHVELIYFVITLLYAAFPRPETLLVLQTVLYVLGALPAFWLAKRRLDSEWAGLIAALVYLAYPVALTAVLFDFHGDTLGMPLLLFAINAYDKRALRTYPIWLVLVLACKEYSAFPIVILGVIMWLQGERKFSLITVITGVIWGMGAYLVIKPLFAMYSEPAKPLSAVMQDYVQFFYSGHGDAIGAILVRIPHALVVLGPALLLGLRAPLWFGAAALVALPVLVSEGPGPGYDYRFHHYALVVPLLIAAVVYGAEAFKRKHPARRGGRTWGGDLIMTLVLTMLISGLFVNTPLNFRFLSAPRKSRLEKAGYAISARDRLKDQWLHANVPAEVPIAATTMLAPHVINRELLYFTRPGREAMDAVLDEVDYVVMDAFVEFSGGGEMYVEKNTLALLLNGSDFHLLQMRDGLYLFGREMGGKGETVNQIEILSGDGDDAQLEARFGDVIGLQGVHVEQVGVGQYRLTYSWVALKDLEDLPAYFAVTSIEGVAHSRYLHLPSWAVADSTGWQQGDVIVETFDIFLPEGLENGEYNLLVSWYDSSLPGAPLTAAESRVGEEVEAAQIEVR
ncbi:MAG: DUF2079 domain-containing protein [Anaerolineales bacterium]|nr:DUF2079 domain-containing protein [Anaerolineales bacterium]